MKQSMSRYLKKYKGLFIINLIVMFIVEFLVRLVAIAMQIIIDTAVYGNFAGMTIIARYIILYMISIVVFAHTELVLNHKLMRKVLKDLKNDLMNGFYNISMMGFRGENSGKYISMMNNDVVEVEREYFGKMLSIFSSVFVIVIALSILFTISPLLLVIQMILSIPPLVFPLFFSKKLTKRKDSQMDALSKYNIRIKDLLSGFE
ncbi:MAG: ABC transporter transmembrane domain-containing protein, partial [Defluviitaleaceae bacterium]|nr:ABC transporter transmembrane domain-containing protein [Defluviitaleaceae bacterium]